MTVFVTQWPFFPWRHSLLSLSHWLQTEGVKVGYQPLFVTLGGGLARWTNVRGCWAWVANMNQMEIMRKDPIKGIGLEQRQEEIPWYNSAKATSVCDSGRQLIEWMPLLYEVRFNTTLTHLILLHPFSHILFYRKPVLPLITHTAGWFLVIFARAVYFHSSIVQIGYCLWCMILKADRLPRDRRQPRRLSEQANKQIQVIFVDAPRHLAPRARRGDIHSIFMPPLKCQKYWWPWAEISLLVEVE